MLPVVLFKRHATGWLSPPLNTVLHPTPISSMTVLPFVSITIIVHHYPSHHSYCDNVFRYGTTIYLCPFNLIFTLLNLLFIVQFVLSFSCDFQSLISEVETQYESDKMDARKISAAFAFVANFVKQDFIFRRYRHSYHSPFIFLLLKVKLFKYSQTLHVALHR